MPTSKATQTFLGLLAVFAIAAAADLAGRATINGRATRLLRDCWSAWSPRPQKEPALRRQRQRQQSCGLRCTCWHCQRRSRRRRGSSRRCSDIIRWQHKCGAAHFTGSARRLVVKSAGTARFLAVRQQQRHIGSSCSSLFLSLFLRLYLLKRGIGQRRSLQCFVRIIPRRRPRRLTSSWQPSHR